MGIRTRHARISQRVAPADLRLVAGTYRRGVVVGRPRRVAGPPAIRLICSPSCSSHGSIDGRTGDIEELSDLRRRVPPRIVHIHQEPLLRDRQLRRLAAQPPLGLSDLHPLARARMNQIGLKLRNHRQHVEQETADGIERVVHGAADAELHVLAVSSSTMSLASRSDLANRSSFETTRVSPLRHAASASRRPGPARSVPVTMVGEDVHRIDAQSLERDALGRQVVLVGGYARIADQ